MWEEGGSYGAISALGVIQITPLLFIVALLRWIEKRVATRYVAGREDPTDADVTLGIHKERHAQGAAS
jgi:uncharacterized membrane protein